MNRRSGLTLIEVILAIVLITIVLAIMAQSQLLSLEVTSDSQIASEATQLANDITEAVQREIYYDFDNYKKCGFGGATVPCSYTSLTGITVPPDYGFTATVTGLYNEPTTYPAQKPQSEFENEGLIKLDVTLSGPSALSFTTYLSCLDEQAGLTLNSIGFCPTPVDPTS